MLIFIEEKMVLFSIPKTATTSVEMTIKKFSQISLSRHPKVKHTTYNKYQKFLKPFVNTVMVGEPDYVSVVRQPVDWLGSWYRYRQRNHLAGKEKSTQGITFDQFVEGYLQRSQPAFAKIGSQANFVSSKSGEIGMTKMFRYDELGKFVNFLEDRLQQEIILPHMNVSPKVELLLSKELLGELERKRMDDFELYDSI